MADKFTVQMGEEDYRLVGPEGEEGVMVPYGNVATLVIEDAIYYSLVDDPDADKPEVFQVIEVKRMNCEAEEVDFPADIVAAQRALDAVTEKHEENVIDVSPESSAPRIN